MVNKNLDLYLEKAKERRNKGISIAIPHYNMSNMIVNCINSLKENLLSNDEIIIVDDGSKPFEVENLKKNISSLDTPFSVKLILKKRSHYRKLGGTRNLTIAAADNPTVLLHIDADDIFSNLIKANIKAYFLIYEVLGDFYCSGDQIQIASKYLLNSAPYPNTRAEDRLLWSHLNCKNKILYIDHLRVRKRTKIGNKRKFKKAFIFIFRHLLVELRVKNSLKSVLINRIKKIFIIDKSIFRSIHNLLQLCVLPIVYFWSFLDGPYEFETELFEIASKKAIKEKKNLLMLLKNSKLSDSDIDYLIDRQFSEIEKKHLKLI